MSVATEVDKKCMEQSAKEYAIWREKHCLSGVAWNVYLLNPVWNTDKRRTPSKSVRDFLWQDNFQKMAQAATRGGRSCHRASIDYFTAHENTGSHVLMVR